MKLHISTPESISFHNNVVLVVASLSTDVYNDIIMPALWKSYFNTRFIVLKMIYFREYICI